MINFFTSGGGSGQIRGHQVAHKIKGKINPLELDIKDNDINIYIKDFPLGPIHKHTYIDVVEDSRGLRWVVNHPEVGVIASSKMIFNYLRTRTCRTDIVFIPQHHCNFERYVKPFGEVKVVGIIGNEHSYQLPLIQLREELKCNGIKLKTLIKKKFKDRKEVCDFYKDIDIQVVYRKDKNLRNPLKLINAMSFGIPTIAFPEPSFVEEGLPFLPARNIDEIMKGIMMLRFKDLYQATAIKGINESQDYHIDFISDLYKALI